MLGRNGPAQPRGKGSRTKDLPYRVRLAVRVGNPLRTVNGSHEDALTASSAGSAYWVAGRWWIAAQRARRARPAP